MIRTYISSASILALMATPAAMAQDKPSEDPADMKAIEVTVIEPGEKTVETTSKVESTTEVVAGTKDQRADVEQETVVTQSPKVKTYKIGEDPNADLPESDTEIFDYDTDDVTVPTENNSSYENANVWDQQVIGDDLQEMAEETNRPIGATSTEETGVETETALGGIYYESEADVARDAELTPEPEIEVEGEGDVSAETENPAEANDQ
ncbi:MAG: hypothetical protein CMK09_17840 [Ponticaulis sp.]|nr:hypothetical protein [Ponticaulis sp.]|tara:strand:- start:3121 stop:3744 length:624 start_codon:yes stop_codon:yes gene_type:complete